MGRPQRAARGVRRVRARQSVPDRLGREEPRGYVEAAAGAFDPDALTVGFARRLATYKRLHLLVEDADRALELLGNGRPVQLVLAGKAHPRDEEGKRMVQHLFTSNGRPRSAAASSTSTTTTSPAPRAWCAAATSG